MSEKKPTLPIFFDWIEATPDPRPYKPGMPKLQPNKIKVAVNVPLTHEYFHNADKLLLEQIQETDRKVEPVLTPKGMKHVLDKIEEAISGVDDDWDELSDESFEEDFSE